MWSSKKAQAFKNLLSDIWNKTYMAMKKKKTNHTKTQVRGGYEYEILR